MKHKFEIELSDYQYNMLLDIVKTYNEENDDTSTEVDWIESLISSSIDQEWEKPMWISIYNLLCKIYNYRKDYFEVGDQGYIVHIYESGEVVYFGDGEHDGDHLIPVQRLIGKLEEE